MAYIDPETPDEIASRCDTIRRRIDAAHFMMRQSDTPARGREALDVIAETHVLELTLIHMRLQANRALRESYEAARG